MAILRHLLLICVTSTGYAVESDCLARVMYAEARGEPLKGVVAVGQAAFNRAVRERKSICKIAAKKAVIPTKEKPIYALLADAVLRDDIPPQVKLADSWNTGKKPAYRGSVTAVVGKHVFYKMAEAE